MAQAWLQGWRRSPLLNAQFVLTIAVGMGAVVGLVSLMLALGYVPLPFARPGQLVTVWERAQSGVVQAISGPDIADFANATGGVFSALGGFAIDSVWLRDRGGSVQVESLTIEANALRALDFRPALGRGVVAGDQPFSSSTVAPAWISYRFWQARYGGSPAAIGAQFALAGNASGPDFWHFRVAGVLPPGAAIPLPFAPDGGAADVWFLLPHRFGSRSGAGQFGLGRLRPGVTAAGAQGALAAVMTRLGQRYSSDRNKLPVVEGVESIAQGPARRTVGLLTLGMVLVFLVGCVNVVILMVAEGGRRRREIAIRTALGANRWQLWRNVALEKCVLTMVAAGLGLALAFLILHLLTQLVPAAGLGAALTRTPPLSIVALLAFTAFTLAAALVWSACLVASAHGSRSALSLASGSGLGYLTGSDDGHHAQHWRLALLTIQAGIGVCLLAAAALAANIYAKLSVADLGPAASKTFLMTVRPRAGLALSDSQDASFKEQLLARLSRLPGTSAVALADMIPPLGGVSWFLKEGDESGAERAAMPPLCVSPGYFSASGIPILFGRGLQEADNRRGSEPVAVISLEMAKENWSGPKQAVGTEIAFGQDVTKHYRVVGVAADFTGFWFERSAPIAYLPESQSYTEGGTIVLRTSAAAHSVPALARQALGGMTVAASISDVTTMQDAWQATLTRPQARMDGMLLLALFGLGLSVQGVYAVSAATVQARGHELAVRSALGARSRQLAWNVTGGLVLVVTLGAAAGAGASYSLQPLLRHWLGAAAVWNARPIAAAILVLALAAAAGCALPVRAAMRANPAEALRHA